MLRRMLTPKSAVLFAGKKIMPHPGKWSPGVGASGVGHAGAPYSRFFTGPPIIEKANTNP